jgi:hypothetical protein
MGTKIEYLTKIKNKLIFIKKSFIARGNILCLFYTLTPPFGIFK